MRLGNVSVYILLVLTGWLAGCGNTDRRQARIPPVPMPGDTARTQAAIQALTRAINQSSPASAYAKRAALYLSAGRVREALADIDEAIDRQPNTGAYYLIRAQVHRALRQPQKALDDALRAEIQGADTPELYTLLGDLLQEQNQFGKARLYLAKALQMAPYHGEAYYFTGLVAAKQGDTTSALALYNRSLQLKPRYLGTYQQLSAVYRSLGNLNASMEYTNRALTYFPTDAQLHFERGAIYQASGKLDTALISYQRAVRLDPELVRAYFQAGLIFDKVRKYGQALTNFNRVKQVQPDFPRIDFYIGRSLEAMGQWEPAVAAYALAMQQNAADQQAYYGYWRAQRRQSGYRSGYEDESERYDGQRTGPVLDTSRVRISTLPSRARLPTRAGLGDSLRPIRPVGPN